MALRNSPRLGTRLEYLGTQPMAQTVIGRRKARWPGPDDGDNGRVGRCANRIGPVIRDRLVAQPAFDIVDRQRAVERGAVAGRFARVRDRRAR